MKNFQRIKYDVLGVNEMFHKQNYVLVDEKKDIRSSLDFFRCPCIHSCN
jgi:hypothetical protein